MRRDAKGDREGRVEKMEKKQERRVAYLPGEESTCLCWILRCQTRHRVNTAIGIATRRSLVTSARIFRQSGIQIGAAWEAWTDLKYSNTFSKRKQVNGK